MNSFWRVVLTSFLLCLAVFFPPPVEADGPLEVDNHSLTLVNSTRISRTVFDFTYRAAITNTSNGEASGVTATLTSLSPHMVVVDGSLSFGNIAAGAKAHSSDTFTIRQDRRFPFDPNALAWVATGSYLSEGFTNTFPLPGEDLKAYKLRLESYFAPLIAIRGERALAKDEGGQYNDYLRFLRIWEPKLYGNGKFEDHFQRESNYYQRGNQPIGGASSVVLEAGQPIVWQEVGPIAKPSGNVISRGVGPVEFITFYNPSPSRILAGSTAGGLFYSTNSGVTWTKTGTDTQTGRTGVGTAVFHTGDDRIWFAASAGNSGSNSPSWIGYTGGIFRTNDGGVSWSQIGSGIQLGGIWSRIFKLAINPTNADQLWAATAYGLFVTRNALALDPIWTPVPSLAGEYVFDFEIRPGNANWVYATVATWSNGNLSNWRYMYSKDDGVNWFPVPGQAASTAGALLLTIEVSPAKADNLYCLTVPSGGKDSKLHIYDFGSNTWKLVHGSANITHGGGRSFGVNPSNPNEIFLSDDTEGRRYTYLGTPSFITLNNTYSSGTFHPDIESLVPHPSIHNEVWMSHHGGVSVSIDNGLTWSDRSTGLGVAQPFRMATAASNPGYVSLGLFHDGTIGTTPPWSNFWAPRWTAFLPYACDGLRPLIDPTNPRYMWHSCVDGDWFHSSDFGATFSANGPQSPTWIVEAVLNHKDPKIQYRVTKDDNGFHTVRRTLDRGDNWTQIADFQVLYPTHDYIVWKVYAPETDGNYLLAHLMSRPKGSEWWTGSHLYRTKVADDQNPANVVLSWEELPVPVNSWIADVGFDPVNANIVYIANSSSSSNPSDLTGSSSFRVEIRFLAPT